LLIGASFGAQSLDDASGIASVLRIRNLHPINDASSSHLPLSPGPFLFKGSVLAHLSV
jgi:hypothetical protein